MAISVEHTPIHQPLILETMGRFKGADRCKGSGYYVRKKKGNGGDLVLM
jgi:hypothetical protein